jgi:uncharacterized protein YbaR (Trm112 family)
MDTKLISLLVCPLCKGPLHALDVAGQRHLACKADRLAFPVRDGIPVMLEDQALRLDDEGQPLPASQPEA